MNDWSKRFLTMAQLVSTWSRDPSTKVGAVITDKKNRIISIGFNGFPTGIKDTPERLNDRDTKYSIIIHAEKNAIKFANRDLSGSTLFTYPFMPCSQCASYVIQSEITRVVSLENDNPRWQASFNLSTKLFKEAGIELVLFPKNYLEETK